ncbi:MAG: hypothetical protein RI885_423 [Actinomycetota bacterium]
MTEQFVSASLVAIWSAMGVYTVAFILFTLDLAKRSAGDAESAGSTADSSSTAESLAFERAAASESSSGRSIGGQLGNAGGITATLVRPVEDSPAPKVYRLERVAFALTGLAWLVHVAAVLLRGFAQGYVPWANMFEFSLTSSAIIVGVFLFMQFWQNLRFLGAYISGFALIVLGVGTVNFYVDVVPLAVPLQSFWLVIHVFVAVLGTAFFALGAGLSITQLLQSRAAAGRAVGLRFLQTIPSADKLETLAYRVIVVGFVFWTFTLIAGAVWAERAWGRYWGWDTKEVWTFIIWTIFAGYIHARATRGWRGSRSAWLAIIGFGAVMFNFTVVNLFFKGLHAYSGL